MADTKHLWRRGGRWYFQIAVPLDVQAIIGRKVVQEALGTADLRQAQRRRDELLGEWRSRFRRAKERRPPSPAELDAVARAKLRQTYDAVSRDYLRLNIPLGDYIAELADDLDGDPGPQAEKALRQLGAECTPEALAAMHQALGGAQIDALESFRLGLEPPLPEKPIAARGRRRQGGGVSFREAAERFVADRMRDPKAAWTAQTKAQNETTFRLFGDHVGDVALASIGRDDVAEFLSTVARLHRDYGRSRAAKGLPLAELLTRYPGPPCLTNKTLNRHTSALSGLFRWARRSGLIDGENPASDQMRQPGDNPYLPFTVEELSALFAGLAFEVQPKQHTLATARPWIMAVALYSGMREGEVCDLDAENVRERDGVPYFDVTRAKSKAGVRLIPVHSELATLGFLDYVAAIGQGPLFPGIAPGSRGQGRAHTFAKRFPAYRRQCGVTRDRLAFHSFRKCFVRALEMAKVDRDRAALVIGHERGFTFRVYNPEGLDLKMLREVVEAVRYPGPSLART